MSHSQFHSTNLFILRHAWLNLWDKHMTTGRINQVTTFRSAFAVIIYLHVTSTHFHDEEFVISLCVGDPLQLKGAFLPDKRESTGHLEPTNGITLYPILAHLKWDPLVPWKGQRSPTFDGDYQQSMTPKRHTDRADPQMATCIWSDHRQAIHLLSTLLKHIFETS
jgi:hypothetical protein